MQPAQLPVVKKRREFEPHLVGKATLPAIHLVLFVQAFAAVQASVVHLQGVPLSKRFALVPLGPPLLSYSSTSKVSLLTHNLLLKPALALAPPPVQHFTK